MAIIDRNHPEGKIVADKWLILEEKIIRALLMEMQRTNNANIGKFDGAKWRQGVKVVGCSNKKSLEFLTSCVRANSEPWKGANIDIVPVADVPHYTTARVWVPPPILEDSNTLSLLKMQNADAMPDDWTIVRGRARDKGNGKDLWIKIGPKSLQTLRQKEGQVNYGIGHLRMIFPEATRSAEPAKSGAD